MNKKTLTNLALITLSLILLLSFASAEVTVNYEVREGIIEDNDDLTETNNPVTGANVEAYVCLDSQCNSVQSSPYYTYSAPSNSDIVKVEYPTNLQGEGYAFYVYKEEFIGWQQVEITYEGTGEKTEDFPVYLSKKRTGFAPLNNFSVYNKVNKNMPIEINVNVGVDAETASIIEDTRLTEDIPFNEELDVDVFLEIFNEDNNRIHYEERNLELEYSENRDLSFTYPGFSETGDYKISGKSKYAQRL